MSDITAIKYIEKSVSYTTNLTNRITEQGYAQPSNSDVMVEVETYMKTLPSLPKGTIINKGILEQQYNANIESTINFNTQVNLVLVSYLNPNTATGVPLFQIGDMNGIKANTAKPTVVKCELRGAINTVIPSGVQIRDQNNNIYQLDQNTTLLNDPNNTGNGYAIGNFTSLVTGEIFCGANSKWDALSSVDGWDSNLITNPSSGTTGQNIETSPSFRYKYFTSLVNRGKGGIGAMYPVLQSDPNIENFALFINDTTSPLVLPNDVILPIGKIMVVVDLNSPNDNTKWISLAKKLAPALCGERMYQPNGTDAYINNELAIEPNIWQKFSIKIIKPKLQQLYLQITYENIPTLPYNIQAIASQTLISFYNGTYTQDYNLKPYRCFIATAISIGRFDLALNSVGIYNAQILMKVTEVINNVETVVQDWTTSTITSSPIKSIKLNDNHISYNITNLYK